MTIAATLATAPLMAHAFDRVSLASLPANMLALPAVAPAMWLGMLSAAAGQLPDLGGLVVCRGLNAVNQLLLAYIEQVAHWFGRPSWSVASVRLASWPAVATAYAGLAGLVWLALRAAERRRGLEPTGRRSPRLRFAIAAALLVALLAAAGPRLLALGVGSSTSRPEQLRVSILDVGQGDSILLQPPGVDPVLVDGGPPGDGLSGLLADRGVALLAAAIVTHDQSDHAAGVLDLLGRMPVAQVGFAEAGPDLIGAARAAGSRQARLAEGDELRFGELRLEVLWPPRELLTERPEGSAQLAEDGIDANRLCLVILAEWRHFSILLSGDAEQEVTALDPGPIDVLKVAHHGSVDSGLSGLLDRSVPDLAVISVGAHNAYGHPTPETLATLGEHGVPALRTDERGTIEIDAGVAGWSVAPGT